MSGDNWIYTYYQRISNGSENVGRWIALLYEYLVKALHDKQFFFDPKVANDAIEYMETHAFHTEGDLAPNPLTLEPWQKAYLSAVYGIKDERGRRQFQEIFLLIGRKNGKTLLASGQGKYDWEMGGFGQRIYCVAPKLDQADLVYNSIWTMEQLDPAYQERKAKLEADKKARVRTDDPDLPRHRMTDLYIPGANRSLTALTLPFASATRLLHGKGTKALNSMRL